MVKETFRYKRSLEMENNTVGAIVEWLFNSEIASKSDKEIMTYVMESLGAACLTELKNDGEKESSEHLVILHFNQFCNSICGQLKSNKPLSFTLQRVVSVDSLFFNLESIKKIAASEPYADDITKRLDMFILKIKKKIVEILKHYKQIRIQAFFVGLLGAIVFAFLLWPADWAVDATSWVAFALIDVSIAISIGKLYYNKTR